MNGETETNDAVPGSVIAEVDKLRKALWETINGAMTEMGMSPGDLAELLAEMTGDIQVIAVDFDGTLCEDRYPKIGDPHLMMIGKAIAWRATGRKVILNTCRRGRRLWEAVGWCAAHGLEFDAINKNLPERIQQYGGDTRKISADLYIDDKAMCARDGKLMTGGRKK